VEDGAKLTTIATAETLLAWRRKVIARKLQTSQNVTNKRIETATRRTQ